MNRHTSFRFPPLLALGLTCWLGLTSWAQEEDARTVDPASAAVVDDTSVEETSMEEPSADTDSGEMPEEEPRRVMVIRIDSAIHPVTAEYIVESLAEADENRVEALVIELNTPGGLLTSTRNISKAMLSARTPVVVYVAPSGAQAASAGFFLLMAGDIAAMAPGTNSGAAHPVGGQGEDIEGHMGKKVEEDAAATIRSLARQHGRNVELAEQAVLESRSFDAEEALENGLIDFVTPSVPQLLEEIDGMEVEKLGEEKKILRTAGAQIQTRPMSPIQSFLAVLAQPELAAILMFLGMLGIYIEITHPGSMLPGVVGAICLILGFFALSVLPINYAGFALMLLAMVLFFAETQVPSFGVLSLGGTISLVLGGMMLFKDVDPSLAVSPWLFVTLGGTVALVMSGLSMKALQMRRRQATTGREGLLGERAVTRGELAPRGKVFVHGEIWNAVAQDLKENESVAAGASVEVVAVEGLTLLVKPSADAALAKGEGAD